MDIIFGEVELYLPKTADAIVTARRLLDLVEDEIVSGWVCKHCGCTENMPCPGGCSWVAPNLCSACAEKEHSEKAKSESPRKENKNSSLLWKEEARKKYVAAEEAEMQKIQAGAPKIKSWDELNPMMQAPGSSVPGSAIVPTPFIFKECEPFKWFGLPTFRAGKTRYHLQQNVMHIMREGYGDVPIWALRDDIKYLAEHPADEIVNTAIRCLYENKRYVLKGFLRDVEFSKIGCNEHRIANGEKQDAGGNLLRKDDVIIPKFQFDKDRKQFFKNIFFVEEPDGRVAIMYGESTYCTTKDRILGVPYPFPPDYFDSKRGWNSTVEQAVKKYRLYLATQKPDDAKDPDRGFKSFGLNRLTKTSGDGEKIEQEFMDDAARAGQ